ncbi:hypothetical protein AMK21_30050 [Streptomyces sp. CB00316]|uniref:hypothetical protein n=1 Tax=Streptomyces sp. CB00316 TaxID=1703932 RepID=UPI0009389FB4|nr:hypothetical protein [Streptomyces sp. CB00316]OKJ10537.1 hypothetical protein AMK21_30050 [Streptomyces sp. CB00316]
MPSLESENLAVDLRAYLTATHFSFDGLTAKEATSRITDAVARWARTAGWRPVNEAPVRYIDPPTMKFGGCITYWEPPWSAYLDLQLFRETGPPVAVEIDREDFGTATDKLRDEALRGRPALWVRWHGALRADVAAGVARLHLPGRSTRSPVRYSMPTVTAAAAITTGGTVPLESQENAVLKDTLRKEAEWRAAALPAPPHVVR